MEYNIGFFVTGLFILLATVYRMRRIRPHHSLQNELEMTYDVSNLDVSGNTRYISCFSHTWVMENITKHTHSRLGALLQEHLANSTLIAGIWIGLVVGLSSMFLTFFFVESLRTIGTVIIIFIVGAMIAIGPGGPKYSEEFLDAVLEHEISELNAQDYVYVKIANDTIKRSVILNLVLAILFVVISPWGDLVPTALAATIAFISLNILWNPASLLLQFNVAFAIIYLAAIIVVMSFICFKIGNRIISPEEEEDVKVQW
ncbi:MAG: hypothetical protein ACFFFK_03835 [Candidatus Thorarchaeota archaeon]